jgi:DNA-binding MarR family transcriptional regulator
MTGFDFDQSSHFATPEESPGFLLWRASISWRRAIESVLKPLGLTHPQFVILATVGWLTRKNEMVSQIEISKQAGLDPNTTSQILRSLEAKKLIKRSHAKDERSKHPILTPHGTDLLAKALPAVEKADAQFFALINLNEIKAMKALQKLAGLETDI